MSTTTSDVTKATKSWSHTKSVKYHLEHTWSIDDFTVLHIKPTDEPETDLLVETDQEYLCISSATFSPAGNDELVFCIQLYPCGDKEENKDSVSLYLRLLESDKEEVNVKFSLAILKANGKVHYKSYANRTFTENSNWGWTFLKHGKLRNKDNDFLAGDVLTIQCKADVIYEQNIESGPDTERMQQLTGECANQLSADLLTLLDLSSEKTSDVILLVSGKEFTAHKLILSARSTVFKAMFESDCKESREGIVEITDVDLEVFEEFLRFIYTGKVTLDENALELLEFADKYATESLKTLCGEYLSLKLTVETVVPILVKADMHSADELKTKAIQFIVSNLATIGQVENWDAALEARPMLALEVVRQIAKASKSPNAIEAK